MNYKAYFKNKKVTVVGLGLLGKRIGDVAFLAECGADVTVTDIKTKEQLAPALLALKKYTKVKYVLGEHRMQDFENKDFILKGQGVALDSLYIEHARKNGIPIEMDESLFAKLAQGVTIVGITGTRGKTTTTCLIYEIIKLSGKRVFLGGNIRGTAALPLIKKVKPGDIVVFELSSWQLQGFGEDSIAPHISVFTNFMPDHLNYYKGDMNAYFVDKSYIYKHQKKEDFFFYGSSVKKWIVDMPKSQMKMVSVKTLPANWKPKLLGEHNKENIALAIEATRALGIKESVIKKGVENFKAVDGRLEFLKKVEGVSIYNDNNATTAEATIVALETIAKLSKDKKVILIMGGADKNLDLKDLARAAKKYAKNIVMLAGSGTERFMKEYAHIQIEVVQNLKEAVKAARSEALRGGSILFSPAFASFGMFVNEYDRGDQFKKIIAKLK